MPTLRYSNNEIYIDVVERLEGTVGRDDHLRRANLYATVVCRSRLSGMPEILIALSKAELLRDASLHPCVRGRRWQQEQILSFIPPDGSVELASFRVGDAHSVALFEPAQQGGAGASPSLPPPMSSPAGNLENAAPLSCHCWMRGGLLNLDPDGDGAMRTVEFEIEIEPRLQQDRHLQEIVVSFELPEDATNVDAVLIGEGSSSAAQRDVGSAGTFMYDSSLHVFRWSIGSLRRSSLARAKGSFETYSIAPRPASSATVQFQVGMHGLSGVRVDSLTLQGEGYKPFKGVRNVLVGDLEYRWS
ncbi:clathrin adaptor, mu subunit [Tilletiaria anomala UBC 951]|uniref:Clathrin adaptor, mu subunit n=1 Tax=Tilletiaria anomala (strain ATCC 24038 / CBS 436.72 / UBC 951) TaxID=1037660 RepID=A0A066VQP5_TILAU|nr:clathrin adaptor, mu subunit [Tilletiaria anomala UBC 951]KDN43781.1 clathrin adaptor, mu subunit [Tilletiaria anomala UBC 951]